MTKIALSVWDQVVSFNNLYLAFKKAARGKRKKPAVDAFEYNLEENLITLQEELISNSYTPGEYTNFLIHDPKQRLISAAPFRDRVVHHALCNVIEPLFERSYIADSYANRRGKGIHSALDRCTQYLRRFDYVMFMDICQFFPSIDHQKLMGFIARKVSEPRTLELCATILNSGSQVHHPNDSNPRPRGLPIGNLTSQIWANIYLNELDHLIKRRLHCMGYIRYVDDLLLFSDEKANLNNWKQQIDEYLFEQHLFIHRGSAQPRPTSMGIPFLGFQVFADHRRLKRRKVVYAIRRMKWLAECYHEGLISLERCRAGVVGWVNHARYADTWGLRRAVLNRIVFRTGTLHEATTITDLYPDL